MVTGLQGNARRPSPVESITEGVWDFESSRRRHRSRSGYACGQLSRDHLGALLEGQSGADYIKKFDARGLPPGLPAK